MKLLQFDEHQIGDKAVVQVLKQIDEHATQTNARLSSMEDKLDKLSTAFPGQDFDGHKRYHETIIEMLAERRRLRQAIQEKTISGLVWMMIVGVGLAVWHELAGFIQGASK